MLRQSYRKLGMQLAKEPLGHEENTYARGIKAKNNALRHVGTLAGLASAGCIFACYTLITSQNREFICVDASGKLNRSKCPTKWWNY